MALVGKRARAAGDLGAGLLKPRRERVERGASATSQPKKPMPCPPSASTTNALLAVVHAERHRRAALVDALQAEEVGAVARPVLQALGADPDISQMLEWCLAWRPVQSWAVSKGCVARLCRRLFSTRRVFINTVPARLAHWGSGAIVERLNTHRTARTMRMRRRDLVTCGTAAALAAALPPRSPGPRKSTRAAPSG